MQVKFEKFLSDEEKSHRNPKISDYTPKSLAEERKQTGWTEKTFTPYKLVWS